MAFCQSDHMMCNESMGISTTVADHDQVLLLARTSVSSAQATLAAAKDHHCGKASPLQQPHKETGWEHSTAWLFMDIGAIYSKCELPGSTEFYCTLHALASLCALANLNISNLPRGAFSQTPKQIRLHRHMTI